MKDVQSSIKELGLHLRYSIALSLAARGEDYRAFLQACNNHAKLRSESHDPFNPSGNIGPPQPPILNENKADPFQS